jgi:hypothetical protein
MLAGSRSKSCWAGTLTNTPSAVGIDLVTVYTVRCMLHLYSLILLPSITRLQHYGVPVRGSRQPNIQLRRPLSRELRHIKPQESLYLSRAQRLS